MPATDGLQVLQKEDPDFKADALADRVQAAHSRFYKSCNSEDLLPIRASLSDGALECFQSQLSMRRLRDLGAPDLAVSAEDVRILDSAADPMFVTLRLEVDCRWGTGDESDERSENWTLVRRRGAKTTGKPGSLEARCPHCGKESGGNLSAVCAACMNVTNSAEADWVVCSVNWDEDVSAVPLSGPVPGADALRAEDPGFAARFLLDRALVLFWRWQLAYWEEDAASLRAVAADPVVASFLQQRAEGGRWYEDPLVTSVDIRSIERKGAVHIAKIKLGWSAEGKGMEGERPVSYGRGTHFQDLSVERGAAVKTDPRTGLHSLLCPSCGAAPADRRARLCWHCKNPLNDPAKGWVLTDIRPFTALFSLPQMK